MAVEDKVDLLISQVSHLGNVALAAEVFSGLALICTAIALTTTCRVVRTLNQPLPPLPKIARIPLPRQHPYDLDEREPESTFKPKSKFDQDILAGLAKELETT